MSAIFLYGPPASGKTTVGKNLALSLGKTFFDLDSEIEAKSHKTIPAIFEEGGEALFRSIEKETLRELTQKKNFSDSVVSLGGGTLLDPENRKLTESLGLVWLLEAPSKEELEKRFQRNPGARPLGNKAEERKEHYASFKSRIAKAFALPTSLVIVGEAMGDLNGFAKLVIADTNAANCQPEALKDTALELIPSGEEFKNISTIEKIWGILNDHAIGRKDTIASFGGGVTSDLVGFAAATWMRGIDWINFPTTLLAMVDASTGGKTGCDLAIGKNLVGAFHSPRLVLIDAERLKTLPVKELKVGKAEMIKHALIKGSEPKFSEIPTAREIADNLQVKVDIVREDPFERCGRRILLNCGHTVGHALELKSNFAISHGEAVAIGCVEEARIAQRMGLAKDSFPEELSEIFSAHGLPTKLPEGITLDDLKLIMRRDKKRSGNTVTFSLPCAWGSVTATKISLE
ncbi:bifunctional shikimate kinase/3-dehydroquinate synthase [bacterium]|nr:bifunctional shikimate kinase/3-dehydroquinate synthase [bacterium]MBR5624367.1 bifunctional shikimate kinase/3-dehydroquinate synthase [bacterium]